MELVIAAHKSVAELGVLGRAEDMHAIMDAERDATLAYLDDLTKERGGRRGVAAVPTETSGLVYAHARHATTRAGDPGPHDHVLIANVIEMKDEKGGTKAPDTTLWREHLHAATMVGRLASAKVAVDLGYGIEADAGPSGKLGHWKIAGIPDAALAVHSKRAAEINEAVPERGFSTYQARQVAARETRKTKRHTSVDDLMPMWRDELEAAGFPPEQLPADIERAGLEYQRDHSLDLSSCGAVRRWPRRARGRTACCRIGRCSPSATSSSPSPPTSTAATRRAGQGTRPGAARSRGHRPGRCAPSLGAGLCHGHRARRRTVHRARRRARHGEPRRRQGDPRGGSGSGGPPERGPGGPLTDGQLAAVGGSPRRAGAWSWSREWPDRARPRSWLPSVTPSRPVGSPSSAPRPPARRRAPWDGRRACPSHGPWPRCAGSIEHDRMRLTERHVLVLDEAGMASDRDISFLLDEARMAGSKVVMVGDDRQLGACRSAGRWGR